MIFLNFLNFWLEELFLIDLFLILLSSKQYSKGTGQCMWNSPSYLVNLCWSQKIHYWSDTAVLRIPTGLPKCCLGVFMVYQEMFQGKCIRKCIRESFPDAYKTQILAHILTPNYLPGQFWFTFRETLYWAK